MDKITEEYNKLIDDFVKDIKNRKLSEQCEILEYTLCNKNPQIGFKHFILERHLFKLPDNWNILKC